VTIAGGGCRPSQGTALSGSRRLRLGPATYVPSLSTTFVSIAPAGRAAPVIWCQLNFVPTIGSIIAAVPAVLMAFVHLSVDAALLATLGFMFVNVGIGNVVEPRVMGGAWGCRRWSFSSRWCSGAGCLALRVGSYRYR
jgi:hypothetical protein